MIFKEHLRHKAALVENWLASCLDDNAPAFNGRKLPQRLKEAMYYSLMAGGKRIRPVLCLSCAMLFAKTGENGSAHSQIAPLTEKDLLPFAAAIECIHSYSLIHDDLPAMDDDDFRRGKLSSHKQFGEATAILAGDALLTDAFVFMASCGLGTQSGLDKQASLGLNLSSSDSSGLDASGQDYSGQTACAALNPGNVLRALAAVAAAAGSPGMVGGQFLDMEYTAKAGISLEELAEMQAGKTGAMLMVSCLSGAMLAGASAADCARIAEYGRWLGKAFQIVDDILDEVGDPEEMGKPVGSDAEQGKVTYPSLLGLEESRLRAEEAGRNALAALDGAFSSVSSDQASADTVGSDGCSGKAVQAAYTGEEAEFLRALVNYILKRGS